MFESKAAASQPHSIQLRKLPIMSHPRISHIGIAVADLAASKKMYGTLLNVSEFHEETVPNEKVSIASFPVGETLIELTSPTDPSSTIAKFIAKRGEGIHHIAFEVENIEEEMTRLIKEGFVFTASAPTDGAHGMRIVFLHPKSTGGVLIELCQTK